MQPFNWSDAELRQSTPTDHDKVRRRYSLDNENFDFHSQQEIFWKLQEQERFEEGLVYFAADFALVEPDCFEQVDEFLDDLEMQYFEKSEEARQVYFKDADETARTALRLAVATWISDHIYVGHQWRQVGNTKRLKVLKTDIPSQLQKIAHPV